MIEFRPQLPTDHIPRHSIIVIWILDDPFQIWPLFFFICNKFRFCYLIFPKSGKIELKKKMVVEATHTQRIIIMEKKLGPSNWLTASRHTHTHGEKKKRKKSGRVIKEQRWCAGGRLLMLLGQRVFDDTTRRRDQVNRTDCAAGGLVS